MLSNAQLYRLKHQHESLHQLTAGLTEQQLQLQVNPGKWSAQQNIAHLAAYQPAFVERMKRIQQEQDPVFERYVAENDPAFTEAEKRSVIILLSEIATTRQQIIQQLSSLDEMALGRTGIHGKYGKMNVTGWIEFFLLHEAHHLFTIFMLTADLRKMQAQEIITFTK